ncbi:MAG: TetR/AcrR family transcriptional regulator [Pseudomonadota bacterium]
MPAEIEDTPSKRAQIVEAALRVFEERGFAAASMDQVSARAGVSKRTVYKHFESKENLFRSIVDTLSARIADELVLTYTPGRDIRSQLTDWGMAEGRLLTSPDVMTMARVIVSETLRSPALAAEAQGKIDKTSALAAVLRAAHDDGQLHAPDAEAAAEAFLALIKARAFWPVIFGADIVTEAQMRAIVDTSVDMMTSHHVRPDS